MATKEEKNRYGVKIEMFIKNPKYMGTIDEEEAKKLGAKVFSYTYGSEESGYKLTWHWAVDGFENTVKLARYEYEGVPSGIAAAHMLALLLTNKTMVQVESINYNALERLLRDHPEAEALPKHERYVVTLAIEAAKTAQKAYIKAPLTHEETTPACPKSSPVSIAGLKNAIKEHTIKVPRDAEYYTKVDSDDPHCHEMLVELIAQNQKALAEKQETQAMLEDIDFASLSPEHQVIAVDAAIDATVRDYLVMDGGDIDILSVKQNGEAFEVYISYLGACSSCESAGGGTLFAIEKALRDKLHPNIRVIPI